MKNSIVPIIVIGGVGYYVYKNWDTISSSLPSIFGGGGGSTTDVPANLLPASWAGVTQAANDAANAAQIKYNQDFATAIAAGNAALAEGIRLDAMNHQVIVGTPRDPRTPVNCLQPNFIKDGVCVSGKVDASYGLPLDLAGLGQILDFEDFFSETPRQLRKGNFR